MSITTPRDTRKEPGSKQPYTALKSSQQNASPRSAPDVTPNRGKKRDVGLEIVQRAEACLQSLLDRLDAMQLRWETDAFSANVPLMPLKRQPLVGLRYLCKRLHDSNIPPRGYRIALASPLVAALLTYALRGILHGDTGLFFLGAVVVSAGTGGLRAGLLTILLCLFPYAFLLGHPVAVGGVYSQMAVELYLLVALVTCVLSDSLYIARSEADQARQQAETLARRSRFLAQASAMLDEPHDYESLLTQVTRAIVPAYADGATIDILSEDETLQRVAVTHISPEKETLLWKLRELFPLSLEDDHLLCRVMRSRRGELITEITGPLLTSEFQNAEYLQLLDVLEAYSILCVPLIARGRCLGALSFLSTSEERRYTHTDLVVAKDLALRVALAIDNMRLYQGAQQEIAERKRMEQRILETNVRLERQRQALEEANIQLIVQANTDGLTDLNNHRAFQEALAKEVHRAQRYEAPLSVLLLDVDRFKQYNDNYGHPAGDKVLRQVAASLRAGARGTDFVARYGGEEFVLILPNTDRIGALEVAERLRKAVEALESLERPVTVSFGVATLYAETINASELVARADKALYASKHAGRNCVTHADTLLDMGQAIVTTHTVVASSPIA